MAKRIQAIAAYCPRIIQGKAIGQEQYMELMTRRSTLSAGVVKNVQENEIESLIALLGEGCPVNTGNAIYKLGITLEGRYEIHVKLDGRVARALNEPGAFRGHIASAENIGKTSDELVEIWNERHPHDLVVD